MGTNRNELRFTIRRDITFGLRAVVTKGPGDIRRVDRDIEHNAQVRRLPKARERGDGDRIATLREAMN